MLFSRKNILTISLSIFFTLALNAQNVGINTTTPDASAALDIASTTSGMLVPRMTTTQRTAISSPATGLLVFDSDLKVFYFYNGTAWTSLGSNASAIKYIGTSYLGQTSGAGSTGTSEGTSSNLNLIAVGDNVLNANTTGENNIALSKQALQNNTTGSWNTAIGKEALKTNTTGNINIAVGNFALQNNTTGSENVAIGQNNLGANTTGNTNTAIGHYALNSNTTGQANTATGLGALRAVTTGQYNIAVGYDAGARNVTGNSNVFLGYQAGFFETGSNKLYISNSSALTPLIKGDFSTKTLTVNDYLATKYFKMTNGATNGYVLQSDASGNGIWVNPTTLTTSATNNWTTSGTDQYNALSGNVGIGTTSPTEKLEILGKTKTTDFQMTTGATNDYILKSDASGNGSWVNSNSLLGISSLTTNYLPKWNGTAFVNSDLYHNGNRTSIGTTTTQFGSGLNYSKLTLASSGSVSSDLNIVLAENTNFAPYINWGKARGTLTAMTSVQSGDQLLFLNANGYDGSTFKSSASIKVEVDGTPATNSIPSRTSFFTTQVGSTSSSERMRIDNSGNVGIGTTSPSEKLEVSGKIKTTNLQMTTGATNGYVLQSDASGNGAWVSASGVGAVRYLGSSYLGQTSGAGSTGTSEGTSSNNGLIAIGDNALNANTTGANNIALGNQALQSNTTGSWNFAIGKESLKTNTSGNLNTAIGNFALNRNTTGTDNVAIGQNVLDHNTTGGYNIGIGSSTLNANTTGASNIAIGASTMGQATTASSNTVIGYNAGFKLSTGDANTFLGASAGSLNQSNSNTMLGYGAGALNASGQGNVFVGYQAGRFELGSSKLYISNSNTTSPLVYGDFATKTLIVNDNLATQYLKMTNGATSGYILQSDASGNASWVAPTSTSHWTLAGSNQFSNISGNVGIGTSSPSTKLHVVGDATLAGTVNFNSNWNIQTGSDYFLEKNGTRYITVYGTDGYVGVATSTPTSTLDVNGSMGMKINSGRTAGTHNPDASAMIWRYTSGTGSITLPAASSCTNRTYVIINATGSTRSLTAYKDFTNTYQVIIANATAIWLTSDGSDWFQIK
jgi:hypothetical protein